MNAKRPIPFSPPDITEDEIAAVTDVLRSGWITTGARTKLFEQELTEATGAQGVVCLNSATAALECALRALKIGPGDEVITSAYTYSASCSVICHVGATPVLSDTAPGSFEMDYASLGEAITERTKAIIAVDIAGRMCDYDRLFGVLATKKHLWKPQNPLQSCFDRAIVIADAAHSFGASYHDRPSGSVADFTAFSFHAVKNLTTAEGGALAWTDHGFDAHAYYRQIMLLSLHGQTKDALSKTQAASWEYDIIFPGWKCNMTDIQAALGLAQLKRYPSLLARRRQLVARYEEGLRSLPVITLPHGGEGNSSCCHLMLVRLEGRGEAFRNSVIEGMAEAGVSTNVHYKPLPLLTAYKNLGFAIDNFPNALAQYQNEITLPLHTGLTDDDVDYVLEVFRQVYDEVDEAFDGAEGADARIQPPGEPGKTAADANSDDVVSSLERTE